MKKVDHIIDQEPRIEPPNWNLDPAIEKTAERLDIFKEPSIRRPMKSLDSTLADRHRLAKNIKKTLNTLAERIDELKLEQGYDDYTSNVRPVPPIRVR